MSQNSKDPHKGDNTTCRSGANFGFSLCLAAVTGMLLLHRNCSEKLDAHQSLRKFPGMSLGHLAAWGQADHHHAGTAGPPRWEGPPGSLQPWPCSGQGHLKQLVKGCFLWGFEYLQGWWLQSSGHPVPVSGNYCGKKAFSYVSLEFPMFVPIASHPFSWACQRETSQISGFGFKYRSFSLFLLDSLLLYIFWEEISDYKMRWYSSKHFLKPASAERKPVQPYQEKYEPLKAAHPSDRRNCLSSASDNLEQPFQKQPLASWKQTCSQQGF